MNKNEKKPRMGLYEPFYGTGTITIGEALPAAPQGVLVGKGGGKTTNYPMDSDEAFARRLKYYEARKAAASASVGEGEKVSA